jgi:hypothetical protein
MLVEFAYNRQWGFIRDKDALTIFYSKMLNEFFQCFVNTSSDFNKVLYWMASQNFIWRYCTYQLSEYHLLLSFFLQSFFDLCDFGIKMRK